MGSAVVVIPARYESTRLPGKPLADLQGKPMIQRVYEQAARAQGIERVVVATDDARIRSAVEAFGGEVVMTSSAHKTGTDRIAEACGELDADLIVNVQGDLPLLDPDVVSKAVAPLLGDDGFHISTLKTPIRTVEELQNPNVVKVVTDRDGAALYFTRSPVPYWREGLPEGEILAYRHIGLYVYRRDFLLTFSRLAATPLEKAESLEQLRALEWGFRIRVVEIEAASLEVDTPEDLEKARVLLGRQAAV